MILSIFHYKSDKFFLSLPTLWRERIPKLYRSDSHTKAPWQEIAKIEKQEIKSKV